MRAPPTGGVVAHLPADPAVWPNGVMGALGLVALSRVRRSWISLVVVGLVAGVVAGLATAAVAGERRSMSAATRLADSTFAPDGTIRAFEPSMYQELERFVADDPDVVDSRPIASSIGRTTGSKDWYYPIAAPLTDEEISRPLVRSGRLPAPTSQNEVAISAATAASTGLDVGSVVEMDLYTTEQMDRISSATEDHPQGSRVGLEVVGIVADTADVAPLAAQRQMLGSDAFYRRITSASADCTGCDNAYRGIEVRTVDGPVGFERLADRVAERFPDGGLDVLARAEAVRAAEPSDGVIRAGTWIMALVVVVVGGAVLAQIARRQLSARTDEDATLHRLGLTTAEQTAVGTAPSALSAVVAALGVPAVAVAVSPLFPIGRARLLEPSPGVDLDVPVVVLGSLLAAVGVVGLVALVARRDLSHRVDRPARSVQRWTGTVSSLPPTVQAGLRVATAPDSQHRSRTFRAAVIGGAVGTAGLVASAVFLHSLDQLVTTPSLYGVDADLSIEVPVEQIAERTADLAADTELDAVVVQWSSVGLTVDGRSVLAVALDPVSGSTDVAALEGRSAVGPDEVVLGPDLARDLGVEVGDTVAVAGGLGSMRAEVVGIGLDPQVTSPAGSRAVVVAHADIERLVRPTPGRDPYPIITVRFAPGVDAEAKVAELDERYPYGVMDESHPSPPALLVALDGVRTVPIVFVWFFGGLAVVAVLNGVIASGRQARHELGVVRSLGFTASQVAISLVVAAVAICLVTVLVGVPVGLLVGAATWLRVAQLVDVVPSVSIPAPVLVVAVLVMLTVAAIGSLWPARWVTARRPAEVLRVE